MKSFFLQFLFCSGLTISTAFAFQIRGMKTPDNFIVDPQTGFYYVSNVDGHRLSKDGRGFISKVSPNGKLIDLRFIDSGKSGAILNAPKGLVIMGGDLYVTDIDRVLRFNLELGKLIGMIDLTTLGAISLNDLAIGPEQSLFVSDLPGNTIYKIEPLNKWRVTAHARGRQLKQPNGLIYDVRFNRLVIASWETGQLLALNQDGSVIVLFKNSSLKSLDGIAFDTKKNIILSSFNQGKVYRLKKYSTLEVLRKNINGPAGLSVDHKNNLLLITSYKGNLVFTLPLN